MANPQVTQEYVEVVYSAGESASLVVQEYVEVVLLVGIVPDDVASAYVSTGEAAGMPRGPGADFVACADGDNPFYVLTESRVDGVIAGRVYLVTGTGGTYDLDDDPIVTLPSFLNSSSPPGRYAWSDDGRYLAVSGLNTSPSVYFYRTDTWEQFFGPFITSDAGDIAFSHDSQYVAISWDVATYVYAVPTWTLVATLAYSNMETCISWSYDGAYLAIGAGIDVVVYETTGWTVDQTLTPGGTPMSVSWHPDSTYLGVITSASPYWVFWDTSGWTTVGGVPTLPFSPGSGFQGSSFPRFLAFSPTGDEVAMGQHRGVFNSGETRVYDWPALTVVYTDVRSDGDGEANVPYLSWGDGGALFGFVKGALSAPGHQVRETVSPAFPGNRGGHILFGPALGPCGREAWGFVIL